jgi:predicted naringenin-chalcone synthase
MQAIAYVTKPVVAHPAHWVTTEEILANIEWHTRDNAGHPHPKFPAWARVIRNSGVSRRSFMYPLDSPEVSGRTGLVARNAAAWIAAQDLAEKAVRQALDTAGLRAADIDALVTSHTTSWAVPQLDVSLINRVGLRPDIRTIAMSSLACIGGAKALGRAADDIRSYPGSRVLVVVAEAISTIYHHTDLGIESQIYKALFGDSAAACIVTSEPVEPGLSIQVTRQYVLPNSAQSSYWGRLDTAGFHFDSTRAAVNGPATVMPDLVEWLKLHDLTAPDWTLIHAGGPAILTAVQNGLGLTCEQLTHSYASLRDVANLGGVSVLDVLRRTHATPPDPGTRGLALSFGPGFSYASLIGTWTA